MEPLLMTAESLTTRAAMKRNVYLMFLCQAFMQAATVGQTAMAALIGYSLAGDKALATLPLAMQMASTMAASIPAGMIFARLGRKPGFMLGACAAGLGSLTFAAGIWQNNFALYCLGALPAGIGFGISQHYRFAAAEVATPDYRPRAISLVMAGGVLSAIFGPELVKHSKDLFAPMLFLGTYLFLALLPIACLTLLAFTRLPPPPPRPKAATPLSEILVRPTFVTAVVAGALAYGTMNLMMTATPLEMMLCGFGISASATVIQMHAVCMFAPGFVTGRLIGRFGARRIIVAGAGLNLICVAVAMTGESFAHFSLALMMLGLGWNFMFTGATNLLAESYRPEERVRAQAANDFIVFGTVACTAFASGAIHAWAGWGTLIMLLVPAMVIALGALALTRRRLAAAS
jgi:MFS family permease